MQDIINDVKVPETVRDRAPKVVRMLYRARNPNEQFRLTVLLRNWLSSRLFSS